jgi:hypothetical protein
VAVDGRALRYSIERREHGVLEIALDAEVTLGEGQELIVS